MRRLVDDNNNIYVVCKAVNLNFVLYVTVWQRLILDQTYNLFIRTPITNIRLSLVRYGKPLTHTRIRLGEEIKSKPVRDPKILARNNIIIIKPAASLKLRYREK